MFRQCLLYLALILVGSTISSAVGDDPVPFRAMTFNIRYDNPADGQNGWNHRRDTVAALIAERKVDFAGLQEVLASQLDDLRERLPEYEFVGVGRDDGQRKGEFSPLLVRKDSFTVASSGTFWLSPTPDKPGSKGWDAALPRVCTWARLQSRESGRSDLLAASTHFDHQGKQARLESATLIRQRLEAIARSEKVSGGAILLGDFNCQEKDAPYSALLGKADADSSMTWVDAYHSPNVVRKGPDSTWNGFKEIVAGQRIDFVFLSGLQAARHEIIDQRIQDRFLSDHLPVLVLIQ